MNGVTVNVVLGTLLVVFAFMLLQLKWRERQRLAEQPQKRVYIPRGYTLAELAEYDGVRHVDVFIAVKGIVYKAAREWYGPDSPYHAFAGRDCSRHLGKVVVGTDEANADWTTLSEVHRTTLNEWEESLRSKYTPVGWIVDTDAFVARAAAFAP